MKLFFAVAILLALGQNFDASPLPQEDAQCPPFCPAVYAPVCGTDGKTYDSECMMKSTACKASLTVFVDYEGDCVQPANPQQQPQPAEKSCNSKCNRDFKPVCGSNDVTYNNICLLEFAACQATSGEQITKVTDGPCPVEEKREGKSAQEDEAAEEEQVEEQHEEASEPVTDPPKSGACKNECVRSFKPVCGSDSKTYNNECLLDFAACENKSEKKLVKVSSGICPELTGREGPSSKDSSDVRTTTAASTGNVPCKGNCNRDFKPVCGSDGVTYNNDCLLEFAACKVVKGDKITKASVGRCREGKQEEFEEVKEEQPAAVSEPKVACDGKCKREIKPVCGSDGVSYNNLCLLEFAACKSQQDQGQIITQVSEGRCREGKQNEGDQTTDTKDKCTEFKCTRELNQVCGSDGKTYNNECVLQFEACLSGSKVTVANNGSCARNNDLTGDVDQQSANGQLAAVLTERAAEDDEEVASAVAKPECKPFCPLHWAPVCGSDGETYGNECELTSKACLSNTDVTIAQVGECLKKEPEEEVVPVKLEEPLEEAEDLNPCPIECSDNSRPVCGSDGKTYTNLCQLNREKCRSNGFISLASKGECHLETSPLVKEEENAAEIKNCSSFCSLEFAPVCGSDGRTYSNSCLLDVESCQAEKKGKAAITKVHDKSCESVE